MTPTQTTKKNDQAHTPGPWRLLPCSHGGAILLRGDESAPMRERHPQSHLQITPIADARLIAMAPDLLEALKLAWPFVEAIYREHGRLYLPNSADVLDQVEDVIARAEGRI